MTLLENRAIDLGDNVILVGGTLWTDMNQGRDQWIVGRSMNDFRIVHIDDKTQSRKTDKPETRVFTTQDAMQRFAKTKACIAKTAKAHPNKIIVVATHHAPSIKGINPEHLTSDVNHGYFTNLHGFIKERPNIKYLTFGHTHLQKAFKIHQCQAISNARGYIRREHCADTFDFDCWFDPVTGEKRIPKPKIQPTPTGQEKADLELLLRSV